MRRPVIASTLLAGAAIAFAFAFVFASPAVAQYNTAKGAGLGGAAGAIIGGVIGHQNDETAEGALIGGAVGALAGGVVGNNRDRYEAQSWQNYNYQQYHAQQNYRQAVSLSDVIVMSRNGLSDSVIVNHIQLHGVQQRPAVHDVITLHNQGVSEAVISSMQSAPVGSGYAPAGPVVVQQYRVVPAYPPPVYYQYRAYHYHGSPHGPWCR